MQPVFTQYVDTYAVRVRPRKEKVGESEAADQPKDSSILLFPENNRRSCSERVARILPTNVQSQLLMMSNHRTQAHLAIYMGIKSIIAGVAIYRWVLLVQQATPSAFVVAHTRSLLCWAG